MHVRTSLHHAVNIARTLTGPILLALVAAAAVPAAAATALPPAPAVPAATPADLHGRTLRMGAVPTTARPKPAYNLAENEILSIPIRITSLQGLYFVLHNDNGGAFRNPAFRYFTLSTSPGDFTGPSVVWRGGPSQDCVLSMVTPGNRYFGKGPFSGYLDVAPNVQYYLNVAHSAPDGSNPLGVKGSVFYTFKTIAK
jgi:hypothetical protein